MVGYLAQHYDRLVTARSMANELGITYQYSMKVINQLKKGDIITSVQGCNGGYRLAEGADSISFYDIICLMEGKINLNRCLGEDRFCSRDATDYCEIHKVLQEMQNDLVEKLRSKKITEVWAKEKPPKKPAVGKLSQTG
jgi:Rrf2 family protein